MAQLKICMRKATNVVNNIYNSGLSRVSDQALKKSLAFDSGQTSQATDSAKSPEWYLDLATKCTERVQKVFIGGVSSKVKLNHNQCKYLAEKLETTVANSRKSFMRSSSPEHKAQCLETLKLLYQLSVEVERFIRDCCKDDWMQSALLWVSMPVRVTSLGCYMELCTELLRNNNKLGAALLACTKLEDLSKAELQCVTERASLDRDTLIKSLIDLSSKSRIEESRLATIILARLTSKEALEAMPTAGPSQSKFLITDSGNIGGNLRELIGKGTRSTLYRGIWMGAQVAVKNIYGEQFAGLQKELSLLESLSHPNIVNFLGYTQDENPCTIVLELMDEDLYTLMSRKSRFDNDGEEMKTPFTIGEAVDLMLQVAEGVNYLHQNRIIHRDLKSQHILVKLAKGMEMKMESLYAKVTDFGLAKMVDSSTSSFSYNTGTFRWMAPEVMKVHGNDDLLMEGYGTDGVKYPFKIDVYSFAMLCYEILTGDVPFSDTRGGRQLKDRVLAGDRPMLPAQCPRDLKSLIEVCWASQPKDRPSFSEICEELRYLKCSNLLEPFDQSRTYQQDQPIAILDLPGLLHLRLDYSCLYRQIQLGKGGSETTVYSAYWRQSEVVQDLVAQKLFIGANNEEFMKEVTILAGLNHPNVVRLLGYATDTRSCSIIMEKMDGDLRDLIRQRRFEGFTMDEAIYIMLQIAKGMHYVHLKNVAHRDLKTCNILVLNSTKSVKHLHVKVADFGLSEKKSQTGNFENVSYNVGTLRWMAPEVIKLKKGEDIHVDTPKYDLFKSDVYSFAMVCFEILTLAVPFADISLEDFYEKQGLKKDQNEVLKKKVLDGERPRLPEYCPLKLQALIESCWNGDARARPSFGEICVDLQGLL